MNQAETKHIAREEAKRAGAAAFDQWDKVYALATVLEASLRNLDEQGGPCPTELRVAQVALQEIEALRERMVTAIGPCGVSKPLQPQD